MAVFIFGCTLTISCIICFMICLKWQYYAASTFFGLITVFFGMMTFGSGNKIQNELSIKIEDYPNGTSKYINRNIYGTEFSDTIVKSPIKFNAKVINTYVDETMLPDIRYITKIKLYNDKTITSYNYHIYEICKSKDSVPMIETFYPYHEITFNLNKIEKDLQN